MKKKSDMSNKSIQRGLTLVFRSRKLEMIFLRVMLVVLICFFLGCVQHGVVKRPNSEGATLYWDFVIDSIIFSKNRNEVLFRDLSRPDYRNIVSVAAILWPSEYCGNAPWDEARLRQTAKEAIKRAGVFSKHSFDLKNISSIPRISFEVTGQEYVTSGERLQPTDYYELRLSIEVFYNCVSCGERHFAEKAVVRRYTCWGTPSYKPLKDSDLYDLFSEAIMQVLSKYQESDCRGSDPNE